MNGMCLLPILLRLLGCLLGMVLEMMANALFLLLLLLLPHLLTSGWLSPLSLPSRLSLLPPLLSPLLSAAAHFNNDNRLPPHPHHPLIITMRLGKILALAGCCLAATPVLPSPEPPLYQMIRGEYQDKIRRYSPPEKIFNVFAVRNENQQYVLTLQGLLQAICFYNYSETTEENLQSFDPQAVKQLLGREKDFEIYDYFAFVRFLAFDRQKLLAFMEERGLSEIDKSAFKDLMLNKVCADYDEFIRENIGIESRQYRPSKQDFLKTVLRSAQSMFSHRESYSFAELADFKRRIMKELYSFEFKCFRAEEPTHSIDGVEFARSILKYAQNNQKRKLLRRVKAIQPGIGQVRVSEKEYVDFHFELQVNMKRIVQALQSSGAVTRKDILELLKGKDGKVSEGQVDVFFRLLDTDDSGFIESRELLGVIASLGHYWNVKPGDQTLQQMLETRWNHLLQKARKIHQILLEQ